MAGYLDLFKRDFKAERLIVVRVEGVLLDCRLLLLQPLAILHQVDRSFARVNRAERAAKEHRSGHEVGEGRRGNAHEKEWNYCRNTKPSWLLKAVLRGQRSCR